MALYGGLFSLVRPYQFYVQIFKSRLGRLTEIPVHLASVPLRSAYRQKGGKFHISNLESESFRALRSFGPAQQDEIRTKPRLLIIQMEKVSNSG